MPARETAKWILPRWRRRLPAPSSSSCGRICISYGPAATPTHYIVMGMDEELVVATQIAVRQMIDFLVKEKGLTKDDAYMLTSVAADFRITQLVDGKKGVHGMIAKAIFHG